MAGVSGDDGVEIPRSFNYLDVALSCARNGLEQDQRFNVHFRRAQSLSFVGEQIGGDPNAVLEKPEAAFC